MSAPPVSEEAVVLAFHLGAETAEVVAAVQRSYQGLCRAFAEMEERAARSADAMNALARAIRQANPRFRRERRRLRARAPRGVRRHVRRSKAAARG